MAFGFDVFGKTIGLSKKYTDNLVSTNKDVLGRDFTVGQKSGHSNMISKAHQYDMVKGVHNWTGIGRNPQMGKDTVTAGQIAETAGGYRDGVRSTIKELDESISITKDPAELGKLEKARAGLSRDKALSYVGEGLAYGKRLAQHTFMEGSTSDRVKKAALYGGAYMGANTAIRTAQGGGMTYNAHGERDIAGIPFL